MASSFGFMLNGKLVRIDGEPTHRTLLQWLRAHGHTGSKEGCAEGDCGACSVLLTETNAHGERTYRSVCSCITLLPMVADREVHTVEGLAEAGPHPVQTAVEQHYGSQCGYCTPGFVASMTEAYYRTDCKERWQLADQMCGNLCRCTGYRPLRDAMESALEAKEKHTDDLLQLRLKKPAVAPSALEYQHGAQQFLRPTSLEELLQYKHQHPDAVLIAGATEIGVEINKKFREFPVLVSTEGVAALTAVRKTDTHFVVGGAATLTALEEAMGEELPSLKKMLLVFASRQIRNRATLAGNLVTASPIGDTAPVLLSLDAEIVLRSVEGERVLPLDQFFVGYRKTALQPKEIVTEIRIPRGRLTAGHQRKTESYKVSKRRELDISAVAVGFAIDVDEQQIVRHARLAYGGVGPMPLRARKTEAALLGRTWDRSTLDAVLPTLAEEFTPITDVRGGAAFRRGVVTSLFEKFFTGERSLAQDEPLDYVPGPVETDTTEHGKALRHESGLLHATGAARYVDDETNRLHDALVFWPVSAPYAHAKILRRDATKARAMPGVAAVLFASDIPGENDVGAIRKDETLLASDVVLFHGHMVAIVVGDSYEACRRAAQVVEVEYEPLPAILSIEEAIAKESFHTNPHRIARGDVTAALASAPHKVSGVFSIGGQEHFYLEAHAAWAEVDEAGAVNVHSSTQHPSEIQAVISHVLHLPRNQIVVHSPRMGGGFGGKETQGNTFAALAALAAWKTKRTVRVQLDRDVDMMLTGKRHPFRAEYEVGFDEKGMLLALRARLVSDGGWALDLSESILDRALFHIDNGYYLPNIEVIGRVAKTNHVSHTAFRGFGGPQGMLVIEEVVDRVARHLGLLPEVVRKQNLYRGEGASRTTHYGQLLEDDRMQRVWNALEAETDLPARRAAVNDFNKKHQRIKRGLALTPVKFGISFTASFLNQAGALVLLYRDGTAQVNHGGTEMGQGLYTKLRGVVMRELGLPASAVRVMKTSTDKIPNTSATAASAGADLNGAAVRNACLTLKERLAPVAADILTNAGHSVPDPSALVFRDGKIFASDTATAGVSVAQVVEAAYFQQISLSATGFYRTPGIGYDKTAGRGTPFHYFAYGAALTEVELDGYSGMKRVVRVDILHDVGDSLNPGIDRGQIEGAFVQGLGWLTAEELLWDQKGKLLTHSASTYQIPAISDAPMDFRVKLFPNATQPRTIHGSKAVGEPPLMLAISVREALRDAVAAFGTPGGTVALPSPATHEALFLAVRSRLEGN